MIAESRRNESDARRRRFARTHGRREARRAPARPARCRDSANRFAHLSCCAGVESSTSSENGVMPFASRSTPSSKPLAQRAAGRSSRTAGDAGKSVATTPACTAARCAGTLRRRGSIRRNRPGRRARCRADTGSARCPAQAAPLRDKQRSAAGLRFDSNRMLPSTRCASGHVGASCIARRALGFGAFDVAHREQRGGLVQPGAGVVGLRCTMALAKHSAAPW